MPFTIGKVTVDGITIGYDAGGRLTLLDNAVTLDKLAFKTAYLVGVYTGEGTSIQLTGLSSDYIYKLYVYCRGSGVQSVKINGNSPLVTALTSNSKSSTFNTVEALELYEIIQKGELAIAISTNGNHSTDSASINDRSFFYQVSELSDITITFNATVTYTVILYAMPITTQ